VINIKATTYELWDGDPIPEADRIGGLLQLTVDGKDVATELVAAVPWVGADAVAVAVAAVDPVDEGSNPESSDAVVLTESPAQGGTGLLSALVMAFIGGSILNVMPCVLPVLTLKLYSLVGQQNISDSERRNAGLAYTAGILASFLVLALAILGVKAVSGGSVGWGFQFQYPGYVAGLATITFLFGLNLFGVFELPTPGANSVAQASAKEGLTGYFLTGVFATLLATPCSAPFLGTGMGFAFSLPSIWIVIFFLVAGLGLALPFLVIAFVPAMMRFLPRPGAWMDSFKQFLGFTLIATTVWLTDVLSAQIGSDGVTGFLIFLTVVSFAAWMYGRFGSAIHTMQRQLSVLGGAVGVIAVGGLAFVDLSPPQASECAPAIVDTTALDFSEEVPWQPFNPDAMAATEGKPVFIDFTADWCFSCKVNERTVLSTRTVREAMEDNGVVPLKADWTNNDPYISEWLSKYNRASIPFYLVIPADRSQDAIEFTEVITPEGIKSAMQKVKHSEG
ncbi:MAG: thioredoxin family protein, partial [Myxococcota bacterium]